ncbi:hypothetical protein CCP3SC15_380023 [Gammaproteobacteria bacterium]
MVCEDCKGCSNRLAIGDNRFMCSIESSEERESLKLRIVERCPWPSRRVKKPETPRERFIQALSMKFNYWDSQSIWHKIIAAYDEAAR